MAFQTSFHPRRRLHRVLHAEHGLGLCLQGFLPLLLQPSVAANRLCPRLQGPPLLQALSEHLRLSAMMVGIQVRQLEILLPHFCRGFERGLCLSDQAMLRLRARSDRHYSQLAGATLEIDPRRWLAFARPTCQPLPRSPRSPRMVSSTRMSKPWTISA